MIVRARDTHHTLRCPHENEFLDQYREQCREFRYELVEGDHYVHLSLPDNVAPLVVDFLQTSFEECLGPKQ